MSDSDFQDSSPTESSSSEDFELNSRKSSKKKNNIKKEKVKKESVDSSDLETKPKKSKYKKSKGSYSSSESELDLESDEDSDTKLDSEEYSTDNENEGRTEKNKKIIFCKEKESGVFLKVEQQNNEHGINFHDFVKCEASETISFDQEEEADVCINGIQMKISYDKKKKDKFRPEFLDIYRIVDKNSEGKYLVVWGSQKYIDATWETEERLQFLFPNVYQSFIDRYIKINDFSSYADNIQDSVIKEKWDPSFEPTPNYFKNDNRLQPHQLIGFRWIMENWRNGKSCLLADDMGLGKTMQAIAFLTYLYKSGITRPFLVVALNKNNSMNWVEEFAKWSDLNVLQFLSEYGFEETFQNEYYYKDTEIVKFNVLVVDITTLTKIYSSYENIKNAIDKTKWEVSILDEAHNLKNTGTKKLDIINSLNCKYRLIMTGTPSQSKIQVVLNILSLLDPEISAYNNNNDIEFNYLIEVSSRLKPYILSRQKKDILPNKKKDYTIFVPLIKKHYEEIQRYVIDNGALSRFSKRDVLDKSFKKDDYTLLSHVLESKTYLLLSILDSEFNKKRKVVVFTSLNEISEELSDKINKHFAQYQKFERCLQANSEKGNSYDVLQKFETPFDDGYPFMICNYKTAGTGMNLTVSSTVIIYELDPDPNIVKQAKDRIDRIGQENEIICYTLVSMGTYDEFQYKIKSRENFEIELYYKILTGQLDAKDEDHFTAISSNSSGNKNDTNTINKSIIYLFDYYERDIQNSKYKELLYDKIFLAEDNPFSEDVINQLLEFSNERENEDFDLEGEKYSYKKETFYERHKDKIIVSNDQDFKRKRTQIKSQDFSDDESAIDMDLLEKLKNLLSRFGFNNWERILDGLSSNLSSKTVKRVSEAIIFEVFDGDEDKYIHILGKDFDESDISNLVRLKQFKKFVTKLKKNKLNDFILSIKRMARVYQYIETDKIRELRDRDNWDSEDDKNLLRSIWKNGKVNYKKVLSDKEFFTAQCTEERIKVAKNRFKDLTDEHVRLPTKEKVVKQKQTKVSKDNRIKKLAELLTRYPNNKRNIKKIAKYSGFKDDIEEAIRKVTEYVKAVHDGTEIPEELKVCEVSIESELAKKTHSYIKWFDGICELYKRYDEVESQINQLDPKSCENLPPEWDFSKNEKYLITFLYKHGLNHFKESSTFSGWSDSCKEVLADKNIKTHTEWLMFALSLKDKEKINMKISKDLSTLDLPYSTKYDNKYDITIESLGTGLFSCTRGFLIRDGFESRFKKDSKVYKCSFSDGLFKIYSDQKKIRAKTVKKAFKKLDYKGGDENLFGFGLPEIRYQYQKEVEKGCLIIFGYIPINFDLE